MVSPTIIVTSEEQPAIQVVVTEENVVVVSDQLPALSAAQSAAAALVSQQAAAASEVAAAASEDAAAASAIAADASEAAALASQVAAAASESSAALSAGTATTQAGIATTQAGIATSAASTATTQAGIATTQASAASASAAAALLSQNSATSSASAALASQNAASASAAAALVSQNSAAASAAAAAQSVIDLTTAISGGTLAASFTTLAASGATTLSGLLTLVSAVADISVAGLAHGFTDWAPTNTAVRLGYSGTDGGALLTGVSKSVGQTPFVIRGGFGYTDPTDTVPAITLQGAKKSGGTSATALGSAETVLQVLNNTTPVLTITGNGSTAISGTLTAGAGSFTNSAVNGNVLRLIGASGYTYDFVTKSDGVVDGRRIDFVIGSSAGQIGVGNSGGSIGLFSSTGLAVTGSLSATGHIGSGTTSPSYSVHAVKAGSTYIQAENTSDLRKITMGATSGSGNAIYSQTSAGGNAPLTVIIGAATAAYIDHTGLAVTGLVSATGIISTSDVTEASSTTVAALKTAGGLAVAKSLRVGLDTYTSGTFYAAGGNNTLALRSTNVSTGYTAIQLANTGGNAIFGMENSVGVNNLIVGATAYDTIVRGPSGIAFSADNGAGMQMRLSSTGLALKATGKIYLDGGGDTYITESSANVLDFYAGGLKNLTLTAIGLTQSGDLSALNLQSLTNSAASYANTNNFLRFLNSSGNPVGGITHPAVTTLGVWGNTGVRVIVGSSGATTAAEFNSSGMSTTGTLVSAGATITGPLNAQYGYFTTQPCLSVGADISATTLTNATRKYAVVSSPHFTSATVMPSTIFRTDSTDATTNALTIGGGAGAFTAFKTTTFYAANDNITLGGNAIASILNTGFALGATNKLYLDGVAGTGDTYITESSANILDLYAGGTKTLSLAASGAAVTGTLSATDSLSTAKSLRFTASALGTAGDYYISNYLTNLIYNAPTGSGHVWAINNGDKMTLSSTGLAVTGTLSATGVISGTLPDNTWGTRIITASGECQLSGWITAMGGPAIRAVNLGGAAYTPLNVDGSLVYLRASGNIVGTVSSTGLAVAATGKLYLDGGGDTYLVESSANVLDLYAGGVKTLSMTASGAAVTGTLSATGVATLGAATNEGVTGQAFTGASAWCLYSRAITPSATNYSFLTNGSSAEINGTVKSKMSAAGVTIAEATSTGLAVTGTLSSTGKATLGASAGGEQIATTSVTTFSGGSGYQSFYAEGAERLRVGWKNAGADAGLVPAQILMTESVNLTIASRDNAAGSVFVKAGSGIPTVGTFTSSGFAVTGELSVSGDTQLATKTPASASATGTTGTVAWDANYLYVCTATNTWKRAALTTW